MTVLLIFCAWLRRMGGGQRVCTTRSTHKAHCPNGVASPSAERVLIEAFCASSGPVPVRSFVRGGGCARFKKACIGGSKVRNTRACKVGLGEAGVVDLYPCSSAAPLVDMQRKLMSIIGMLREAEGNFSLSHQYEVGV